MTIEHKKDTKVKVNRDYKAFAKDYFYSFCIAIVVFISILTSFLAFRK